MNAFNPETIGRFKVGGAVLRYEEAVKRVVAEVADLEGNVDVLVVAAGAEGACKWSSPFASATTRGGRSALVRVTKAAPGQASDPASRARLCDVAGDKDAVGMAVEVAVDPATAGGASDRLLREALEAAAKSLLTAAPPAPEAGPKVTAKAETEPPADRRSPPSRRLSLRRPSQAVRRRDLSGPLRAARQLPPPRRCLSGSAVYGQLHRAGQHLPDRGRAVRRVIVVRFLKRTDSAQPWEGIRWGSSRAKAGSRAHS